MTDDTASAGKHCPSCACTARAVPVMTPDGVQMRDVEPAMLLMFPSGDGYKAQVCKMASGTASVEDLEPVGPAGQYDRAGTLLAELPQMTTDEMKLAGVFHPQQPEPPFWAGLA